MNPVRWDDFLDGLRSVDPVGVVAGEQKLVAVSLDGTGSRNLAPDHLERLQAVVTTFPALIVGVGRAERGGATPDVLGGALVDVAVPDMRALAELTARAGRAPLAAAALAILLRGAERRTIEDGLVAESAVYSALQAGPEFGAWRASRERRPVRTTGRALVQLERAGGEVTVTLDRAEVHNALDTQLRAALIDALAAAASDESVVRIVLRGAGPSFCSGGDLDEFGSFADPAHAHLVRLRWSAGAAIAAVADRTEARIHGASMGAGIELAAFADRVVADPDVRIALPELDLGLVPGAGGTVSLPRRIGRHRTAWLALSGEVVDAATALSWGLVDAVEPR